MIREEETDKRIDNDTIIQKAIKTAENDGIVFLDEIDKVLSRHVTVRFLTPLNKICPDPNSFKSDTSDEGVQRDLLPLIEGTTTRTKHGMVDTSKILFIAAGAFHQVKPSDLLAELQVR